MTEIKALADITSEITNPAVGDLLFIESGGVAAKITYSDFMGGSHTASGTVTVTGTYNFSGGTLTLADNQIGGVKVAAATVLARGTVEKSTSAENLAGTASDKFPDVPGVKEMVEAHGGLVQIATIDLASQATADFTGFDATKYGSYEFVLSNVIPATDAVRLQLQLSNDAGSTFLSGASAYQIAGNRNDTASSINITADHFDITAGLDCGNDANKGISGRVCIHGPDHAAFTMGDFRLALTSTAGALITSSGALRYDATAEAHDAARFLFSSGNLASGRITMFGRRKP